MDTISTNSESLDFICASLANLAMQEAFRKTPFPWQVGILTMLFKMTKSTHAQGIHPAPVFLCHPTGGGKLLVRDTFGAALGGVVWCISPLLALGANQASKLQAQCHNDNVVALHLDEYKTQPQQLALQLCLVSICRDSNWKRAGGFD